MRKSIFTILLLCMCYALFAQSNESLVTSQMAKKTATLVRNNMGLIRGIFQDVPYASRWDRHLGIKNLQNYFPKFGDLDKRLYLCSIF